MIKQLFIKSEEIKVAFAENLFISLDKVSALKADYEKVLNLIKVYNNLEVLNFRHKELTDFCLEDVAIVKCDNSIMFVRLVIMHDEVADVLVYTLNGDNDIIYYKNIFFKEGTYYPSTEMISIYKENKNTDVMFIYEDNHIKLVHKTGAFLKLINYEDWDFENKFSNCLDLMMTDCNIYKYLDKDSFEIEIVIDKNVNKEYKFDVKVNKYQDGNVSCFIMQIK